MIWLLGLLIFFNSHGVDGTCSKCISCLSNTYDSCIGGTMHFQFGCFLICNVNENYQMEKVCNSIFSTSMSKCFTCVCPTEKPVLLTTGNHINGICITKSECAKLGAQLSYRKYGQVLDQDSCPDPTSEEYFQLQQIDFLYSDGNDNGRCFKECQQCKQAKSHCKFEKLRNHIIEKAFSGLFYSSPEAYVDSGECILTEQDGTDDGKFIPVKNCPSYGYDQLQEFKCKCPSRSRRATTQSCIRKEKIKKFRKSSDNGQWHAVHFIDLNDPHKCQFQYYEEVKCESSANGCHQKNTVRTFLMTTVVPGANGHLYAFFTNWGELFSNIKFKTFNLPGHCFKSVP